MISHKQFFLVAVLTINNLDNFDNYHKFFKMDTFDCEICTSDERESTSSIICKKGHVVCSSCSVKIKSYAKKVDNEKCVVCFPLDFVHNEDDVASLLRVTPRQVLNMIVLRAQCEYESPSIKGYLDRQCQMNEEFACARCHVFVDPSWTRNYYLNGAQQKICTNCMRSKLCNICRIQDAHGKFNTCQDCHDGQYKCWKKWVSQQDKFVEFKDVLRRGIIKKCHHLGHGSTMAFFVDDAPYNFGKEQYYKGDDDDEKILFYNNEQEREIDNAICSDHVVSNVCKRCVLDFYDYVDCPEHFETCMIDNCDKIVPNHARFGTCIATCSDHFGLQCKSNCDHLAVDGYSLCDGHISTCKNCDVLIDDKHVQYCDECKSIPKKCQLCSKICGTNEDDDKCAMCIKKKQCFKCDHWEIPSSTWHGRGGFCCRRCIRLHKAKK